MDEDDVPAGMTETEAAVYRTKQKHAAREEEEYREYMEERAEERVRIEQELEELKERQIQRRQEREEEMQQIYEMQRLQEERRKQDEEERKAKNEADKRRKEAERKKKQEMMAGGGIAGMAGGDGKRNFTVNKKSDGDAGGDVADVGEGAGRGGAEDSARAKEAYMARFKQPFDGDDLDCSALRARVQGFHEQIVRLVGTIYDLQERQKIQEYDLKELGERAKQQARQKALAKGLDPEEAANAKHPVKKPVASQYDRQIDRRSYADRKKMYAECLRIDGRPVLPPPKKIFHGSCKPPEDFGRPAAKNEELEALRKNMEPPKYQELAPVEGAKAPMAAIPSGEVPADDEEDLPQAPAAADAAEETAAAE